MKLFYKGRISCIILIVISLLTAMLPEEAYARPNGKSSQQTTSKGKTSRAGTKGAQTGRSSKGKKSKGNAGTRTSKKSQTGSKETVKDVKRREAAARKEIALTQEQIRQNDLAMKRGLNQLGKLQEDIAQGKVKLAKASGEVKSLETRIKNVEGEISREEMELSRLREEYLKAVKQMRIKKKSTSSLAFIFSSKDFSEAMRRMRYLKQFSEWRENRNAEINGKVRSLKSQKELLGRTKASKDQALKREAEAQTTLNRQYAEQDAVVVKLKANGEALKTHLANKQSEANALNSRVATLIAEEQARIEAERRAREAAERKAQLAREEAARKAEEERKAEIAREEAAKAAARKAEETKNRELAQTPASGTSSKGKSVSKKQDSKNDLAKAETKKESRRRSESVKKETKVAETKKKESKKQNNTQYADARKRRPRSQRNNQVPDPVTGKNVERKIASSGKSSPTGAGADFAGMKGSLPRPVSGSFRITSRFGRHSLPDLPDVMYDNPGIDAEVASGASAQAVYAGRVSGVYVIPGFSSVVIVNHGNYYTVYGNIQKPAVKVGDNVKQGSNLGRLAPEEDNPGKSSIHFEVWRNREKLDPAQWIR